MKIRLYLIFSIFFVFSCEEIITPEKGKAEIFLSGDLIPNTLNNLKGYQGSVINRGMENGYNCVVNISCIDTSNADSVLGSLKAYPADGGDIKPAERVGFYTYFDSAASSVFNFDLADSFYVIIEYDSK